ncbi:iron(3+)-hydroxamate import ATP-binding protein FhuC [Marinobacterium nitratireducens]|uniref:Iron(3+)-hydroxamate import ATP-binding protein FhuC n=1 Tax=Marinobacterium nitratireducens TaxID=518897 RepID=A0A918DWD3_9GAMM|nr:ABC transporter ATP-binding protein [Marinobacterium nitratireducens]GGO84692.1 iron(3+)-hydroxamate import ATP-binding protein FhuC [Marinobacterium nitratireducens]
MLSAQELRLGYGDKAIVPQLSLDLEASRIHCLIGPNGCGKSTLLRALSGLLRPQQGRVLLEGRELNRWGRRELAQRLAMLPQHPSAPEGLTVEQLVRYGRFPHQRLFGQLGEQDRKVVRWAIRVTGLAGYEARPLAALSGGERQRAWIALSLAQQAAVLVLDEPTTYLDLGHQLEVLELLEELNRQQGLTVIMSLHDLNQAARYGHQLIAMRSGRLERAGNPGEVLSESLLAEVFRVRARVSADTGSGKPQFVPLSSLAGPVL